MNYQPTATCIVRTAFFLFLLLAAACATVNPPPVEEKAAPQAPGAGFDTEPPAGGPAPATAGTTAFTPPEPAAEPPAPAPGRITPRQKYVNVRPRPATDNRPVAVLPGGKKVEVLGREGTWTKIRWTRGKKTLDGWVAGKFVETMD